MSTAHVSHVSHICSYKHILYVYNIYMCMHVCSLFMRVCIRLVMCVCVGEGCVGGLVGGCLEGWVVVNGYVGEAGTGMAICHYII